MFQNALAGGDRRWPMLKRAYVVQAFSKNQEYVWLN
jgi:hypothetical protein